MDYIVDQLSFVPDEWRPALKEAGMRAVAWGDWFVALRNPLEIFALHSSYCISEYLFYFLGLLTFIHAWRSGQRYWFTWIGILIHGVNTEALSYNVQDFENFWHAQTSFMLLGRRLPLHIMLLYPVFDYTATIAAKRLRLPWWGEGPLVGLLTVVLDLPYDILGAKLIWWTWHDTDPNVFDRMYHVPWTSYYFHAAFACSFNIVLNATRRVLLPPEYDWKLFPREFFCCLVAGVSAFWLGAIQFIPIYHFMHDLYEIHSEVPTLIFLFFYVFIVWVADRHTRDKRARESHWWFDEIMILIVFHFVFYMFVVCLGEPESIQSIGLHEPIGNCNDQVPVQTVSGLVLSKRKYLCRSYYDEPCYDLSCKALGGKTPELPPDGRPIEWYTICGTKFENHAEYISVVWACCLFGFLIFYQVLIKSGIHPSLPNKVHKKKKD